MEPKDLKNAEEFDQTQASPEEQETIETTEVKEEPVKKTTRKKQAVKSKPDSEDKAESESGEKTENAEKKGKLIGFLDNLEEKANELREQLVEKTEEILSEENIAESKARISELAEKVSGKISEVTQPVIEKVEELTSEEKIAEGKAKLSEIADTVYDKIEKITKPVIEKVEELTSEEKIAEGKEKLAEIAEKVSEKISDITQPVTEKLEELIENAKESFTEKKSKSETTSEAEPVAEAEEHFEEDLKERIDYTLLSQVELVNALRDLIDEADESDIKADVDAIKSVFYKHHTEKIEMAHQEFIAAGGKEEDFVPEEDPYENDIKELLKKYTFLRKEHNKQLDTEKEENLKRKLEIIDKIKSLINNEESINKTFNEFRELQREWREIGPVPQAKMKNLWDTYHFHVENFYDYIKINRELRDLDLKRNLEAKIKICENAEELLVETNVLKAFNTLQKYHEQWREIGPVPRENKDDVWERFKLITSKINKKHQDYFESKKSDQKKNYDAKIALCEKVEEIANAEINSYKDWDDKSKELVELQKVWRTIGFAPKKDNNKIYERFRVACDNFFNKKRDFYSKNKEVQQNNLQLKIDLCVQAEALMENTDWKKATQEFINIQKKWKEIGPIPRKHSDIIWKRFRAACDFFFDKKSEHFNDIDSEQAENLKQKELLIAEVESFKPSADVEENLSKLKDIQRRRTENGHVPFKKKDAIQNKFREEISKLFDQLSLNEEKRNMLRFKSKMSTFHETQRGQNKMRMEREKYMTRLKQLENDLVLLDNNIGFFAKSKNAEALIEDVKRKIEDTRHRIEELKEKIRVIDEMED